MKHHMFLSLLFCCSVGNRHTVRRVVLTVAATCLGFPCSVLPFQPHFCLLYVVGFLSLFLKACIYRLYDNLLLPPGSLPCIEEESWDWDRLGSSSKGRRWDSDRRQSIAGGPGGWSWWLLLPKWVSEGWEQCILLLEHSPLPDYWAVV